MNSIKNWVKYFSEKSGRGIFATADSTGRVNVAVYSSPHLLEDGRWAFIVAPHRTLNNLRQNPYVAYSHETGQLEGFRFYLELDELLHEGDTYNKIISQSRKPKELGDDSNSLVAVFNIIETRPLVGG